MKHSLTISQQKTVQKLSEFLQIKSPGGLWIYLLWGPPLTGKSFLLKEFCNEYDGEYFSFPKDLVDFFFSIASVHTFSEVDLIKLCQQIKPKENNSKFLVIDDLEMIWSYLKNEINEQHPLEKFLQRCRRTRVEKPVFLTYTSPDHEVGPINQVLNKYRHMSNSCLHQLSIQDISYLLEISLIKTNKFLDLRDIYEKEN